MKTVDNEPVFYVNKHQQRVPFVLLVVGLLVGIAMYGWLAGQPYLHAWLVSPTVWLCYLLLFGIPLVVVMLIARKEVWFSVSERAVYSQTPISAKNG